MEKTIDLKNRMKTMEIGENIELPIERMRVVRTYAYELSLLMERVYHSQIDREKRIILVSREA